MSSEFRPFFERRDRDLGDSKDNANGRPTQQHAPRETLGELKFAVQARKREGKGYLMSVWFKDDAPPFLLEESVKIALDFLSRTGEIDDPREASQYLVNKVEFMMGQGQRNRLLLANRAIAAYQRYRKARTLESSPVS